MEWISVNDRLPKNFEWVIAYIISSPVLSEEDVNIAMFDKGKWFTPEEFRSNLECKVSHWMPLPKPPKNG